MKDTITIIGASILDVLVSPASKDVFTSGSFGADSIQMSFGADALNEAIILSKMNQNVFLQTILGNDTAGNLIKQTCQDLHIQLPKHVCKDHMTTGINVVLIEDNGERNFLTNKNGSLRKLTLSDIDLDFHHSKIVCFASIFVFPELKNTELTKIFSSAKKQHCITIADMTKRKNQETIQDIKEALSYIDYLIPNFEEASLLTRCSTMEDCAKALFDAGVKHVIIKCGKQGCFIYDKEYQMYVHPTISIQPIDTTGAGDSFVSGFIYGLSKDWDIVKCAMFANRCGGLAVQSIGATEWTKKEDFINLLTSTL